MTDINETEAEQNAEAPESEQSEAAPQATGETQASATPDADAKVPVRAVIDERRKRQEAQENVRALEMRIAAMERETLARSQKPEPELTEDEILGDLPKALRKQHESFNKALNNQRYAISEAYARRQHADYDDAVQEYMQLARNNPRVAQEIDQSPLPALAMYDYVQSEKQKRVASDPAALEQKIQEEVQKRLESELAKLKGHLTAGQVPPSIASARGNGTTAKSAWSGPRDLRDIFKGR